MFGNLGLHVIKNPAGTYSYVGSIPMELATLVPMTKAGALSGRAFKDADGNYVEPKFPVFPTEAEAVAFAESKGFEVRS